MCYRHFRAWQAAGRPALEEWIPTLDVPADQGPACRLPHCEIIADSSEYCPGHAERWRRRGRPDPAVFEAEVLNYGDRRHDFKRLPRQLQLEIQYVLQCHHDEGRRGSTSLTCLVRLLLTSRAASLLERDRDDWDELFMQTQTTARGHSMNARAFLGFAVDRVVDLVDGSGWKVEYPRDVWEIRRLPLATRPHTAQRRLVFADITQPWLRALAKTWLQLAARGRRGGHRHRGQ